MRKIGFAGLLFSLTVPLSPTQAFSQSIAIELHSNTARGLMAQADLARVRERRLADDREVALIAGYEQRIGGLHRQLVTLQIQASAAAGSSVADQQARRRAETQLTSSRRELATARDALATLAEATAQRDADWSAEREAYRSEMQGMVAEATPEKLAALEKFADGDRVGAWPVLRELTEASVRARMVAAGQRAAVEMRQLAEQRGIMQANGEASSNDVLTIWEEAVRLDPSNFDAQRNVSNLKFDLGDLAGAIAAAEAANAVARTDRERANALDLQARVKLQRGDFRGAAELFDRELGLVRHLANDGSANPQAQRDLMVSLSRMGDVFGAQNRNEQALTYFAEALTIARSYAASDGNAPSGEPKQLYLAWMLSRVASYRNATGDRPGALAAYDEGLILTRALNASQPDNVEMRSLLVVFLTNIGEIKASEGNFADAESLSREALTINRSLAEGDPSNQLIRRRLTINLLRIGQYEIAQQRLDAAMQTLQESLTLARSSPSIAAGGVDAKDDLAEILEQIGTIQGARSDRGGAVVSLVEAWEIRRALHGNGSAKDPTGSKLMYDWSALGDALAANQNLTESAQAYAGGAAMAREFGSLPNATYSDIDQLVRFLGRLGLVLEQLEDWNGASAAFNEEAPLLQKQIELGNDVAIDRREYGLILAKLGDMARRTANPADALKHYRQALTVFEAILAAQPEQAEAKRNVVIVHVKIGELQQSAANKPAARDEYDQALGLLEALAVGDPEDAGIARMRSAIQERIDSLNQSEPHPGSATESPKS